MARWRLAAPHYLKIPGTTWEYKEVDRKTGKQRIARFAVPMLLDPSQPSDWNYRRDQDDGDIIVCHEGKGQDQDLIFEGDPTPDMVPLDDEAKAISAGLVGKWNHPIESLPGSYADQILNGLQEEVAKVQSRQSVPQQIDGMQELLSAMTAMMKQNQMILESLTKARRA